MPSLFILSSVSADTLILKNDRKLKGLVVERHADRIILSTEKGEIPILSSGIRHIEYDAPEQNFMQAGRAYEAENKLGESLAYYEKALEINPDFEEARRAATSVRNRFWAKSTEGPQNEIEKKQLLYDSWDGSRAMSDATQKKSEEQVKTLKQVLGLTLEKKGDWVRVKEVIPSREAGIAGLRLRDRLTSLDSESLRYLTVDVVARKMLEPKFTNFSLEIERDCFLSKGEARDAKGLGFKLSLTYEGIHVDSVEKGSPAERCGLGVDDHLVAVDGVAIRYTPMKKILEMMLKKSEPMIALTIRRSAFLTRR